MDAAKEKDPFGRARRGIAAVLLLLVAGAVSAQAPRESNYDIGVPYLIPLGAVDLDDKQREAIMAIRRELHDRYCTLAGELLQAQEELRAETARRPARSEAAAAAFRRVSEVRDRILESWAEAEQRALQVLTAEQRTVLAKWQEGRRAPLGGIENIPYTVLPGIEMDKRDIENQKEPELTPRY